MSRRRVEQYKEPPMPTSIRIDLRMKAGNENRVRGKRVMRGTLVLKGDEKFKPAKEGDFYIEFVDIKMPYHRSGFPVPMVQAYSWEELKENIPQLRAVGTGNSTVARFLRERGFEVENPDKKTVSLHATIDEGLMELLEEETKRRNSSADESGNPEKRVYLGNVVSDILCQYFEKKDSDSPISTQKDVIKEAVTEALESYFKK